MADDQQQDQDQDETQDDEQQQDGTGKDDAARGGDDDKPGAALLKALNEERDARRKAESTLRKREQAERQAETDRAIKAGEWESVAKAKDTEIADLNARIEALEGQIATSQLDTIRERMGSKYGLPAKIVAVLKGATDAEIEADAKEWKKALPPPPAGNTELGRGNGQGGARTVEQIKAELKASGRYASVG